VAFSVSVGRHRASIVSDLGCITRRVLDAVRSSELLLIEANYDDHMLSTGSYPDFLKRTIRSEHGHLSNADSAALCAEIAEDGTKSIVLVHLSKENNTPDLAERTVSEALKKRRKGIRVQAVEHGSTREPIPLR
jgi:phosphoribosyl 1,2-cyclic phosphodiesterase